MELTWTLSDAADIRNKDKQLQHSHTAMLYQPPTQGRLICWNPMICILKQDLCQCLTKRLQMTGPPPPPPLWHIRHDHPIQREKETICLTEYSSSQNRFNTWKTHSENSANNMLKEWKMSLAKVLLRENHNNLEQLSERMVEWDYSSPCSDKP